MTGCLVDILNGNSETAAMLSLVLGYVAAIAIVQVSRYVKRFYVRRFANNVNRRMKQVLYRSLVTKSRASLKEEGEGDVMTKAILDVDDCAEGMRKFTTEISIRALLWQLTRSCFSVMLAAGASQHALPADFLYYGGENEKNDPAHGRSL